MWWKYRKVDSKEKFNCGLIKQSRHGGLNRLLVFQCSASAGDPEII